MKSAKENNFCLLCMEEHVPHEVEVVEPALFKGIKFTTTNKKLYCENVDEYLITEEMMDENDIRMKDAYRKAVGLLTSKEIHDIRDKYDISQKDLSKILEWGELTITRYENHYVQDRAHNDILVEIQKNPVFLYDKLKLNKELLSISTYKKVMEKTKEILDESGNFYLVNSILSEYEKYTSRKYQGNVKLSLDKVVDTINYIASKVENLFSVKLMKLLWYTDFLHFKRYGNGITGLYYFRNSMGALPKEYDKIILLDGINSIDEFIDENFCKRFVSNSNYLVEHLSEDEIGCIDTVIQRFGKLSTTEIIEAMHEEDAYKYTQHKNPISYEYAQTLSIE